MRIRNWGVVIPLAAIAAFAVPSLAATGLYATEDAATATCGTDEVVCGRSRPRALLSQGHGRLRQGR